MMPSSNVEVDTSYFTKAYDIVRNPLISRFYDQIFKNVTPPGSATLLGIFLRGPEIKIKLLCDIPPEFARPIP